MDYKEAFGFTDDEIRHWTSLKAPERVSLSIEIAGVLLANTTITILLIYGVINQIFWMVYLAVFWVLLVTTRAIDSRLRIKRSLKVFRSIAEKVDNSVSSIQTNQTDHQENKGQ